jgi:hypothetical protein
VSGSVACRGGPALAAIVVLFGLVGCSSSPQPTPEPSSTRIEDTITATDVGDHLVVTASVTQVLDERAFVVQDVDLPSAGLLVLCRMTPPTLTPPDLVMVDGHVQQFSYPGLSPQYRLTGPDRYRPWGKAKILVADDIKRLA